MFMKLHWSPLDLSKQRLLSPWPPTDKVGRKPPLITHFKDDVTFFSFPQAD